MNRAAELTHPRDAILATMARVYRDRMTTTSGGNISVRRPNGDVWITPAGVDKGGLSRDDIVRVGAEGGLEPSGRRPSSEWPFHRAIYAARDDIHAIVHAHPVALVAFSMCGRAPDTRLFHQAHSVCGRVGFAPYALPGSEALGRHIAAVFAAGNDCVVLENHGVVVGGGDLAEAFERFEAFEFAAKTLIRAHRLGEVRLLDDEQLAQARDRSVSFQPLATAPPSDLECELRRQLREFVRRGCRQRLLISTEGSFSARLDDEAFLITPSRRDRESLELDDFVLVRGEGCERGKQPSRAAWAHRALYRAHPEARSIVFAHPVSATAFSVTGAPLDARTIPESYLFLRDVARAPYGAHYGSAERLAEYVGPDRPAAILENDGVVVVGSSVLDAFDRLEVLESTAEAICDAGAIGPMRVMPDSAIDQLRAVFLS